MSIVRRFLSPGNETRAISSIPLNLFGQAIGTTKAGINVSQDSALQNSTVWGCIRLLSDGISTLPLDTFIRRDGARRPYRPRPDWLSFQEGGLGRIDVMTQIMVSLLLSGNAYLATFRNGLGEIQFIEVLDPAQVEPFRKGSQINFRIMGEEFNEMDIHQIRGMTLPGSLVGLSPIAYNKETIALSIAATQYGAAFFGNGAIPGTSVEVPGALSEVGMANLRRAWEAVHKGVGNAHRLAILTEGAKFTKISIAPEDAQFLQTRQFQVPDVARIFGVPVHLLSHPEQVNMGTSLSEQNTAFVQYGLRPWVERIEAAFVWLMKSEGHNPQAFVKFNMDGLMRGDHDQRIETYVKATREGIFTVNECRAWEDLPPVPWGDTPNSVQFRPDGDIQNEGDGSNGDS